MLRQRATFEDGTNGVEAGVAEMLTRMQTMRFRVFSHLNDWFEEFRLYHRAPPKDGRGPAKIVKERDDAISASRYAMMMLRFADTMPMEYDSDDLRFRRNTANAHTGY